MLRFFFTAISARTRGAPRVRTYQIDHKQAKPGTRTAEIPGNFPKKNAGSEPKKRVVEQKGGATKTSTGAATATLAAMGPARKTAGAAEAAEPTYSEYVKNAANDKRVAQIKASMKPRQSTTAGVPDKSFISKEAAALLNSTIAARLGWSVRYPQTDEGDRSRCCKRVERGNGSNEGCTLKEKDKRRR